MKVGLLYAEGTEVNRTVVNDQTGKIYQVTLPESVAFSETYSVGANQVLGVINV